MADYFTQLKRKGLNHHIVWVQMVGAVDWRGKEDKSIDNGGGGNIALEGNGGRLIAKQGHKGLGSTLAALTDRLFETFGVGTVAQKCAKDLKNKPGDQNPQPTSEPLSFHLLS